MPAKIIFICIIHLVRKKNTTNYIIRKAIAIIRSEEKIIKVTAFFLKNPNVLKYIPLFTSRNILRFTEKFAFNEKLPYDILKVSKLNY